MLSGEREHSSRKPRQACCIATATLHAPCCTLCAARRAVATAGAGGGDERIVEQRDAEAEREEVEEPVVARQHNEDLHRCLHRRHAVPAPRTLLSTASPGPCMASKHRPSSVLELVGSVVVRSTLELNEQVKSPDRAERDEN